MIHISHQTQSIAVPYSDQLGALFPHGAALRVRRRAADPRCRTGSTRPRCCATSAIDVPCSDRGALRLPLGDGKRPFAKQVLTAALMTMNTRSFVLNGMGTGKTKAAIWSFDYPQDASGAPSACWWSARCRRMRFTWEREIFNTLPGLKVEVLTGTAERRRKLLAEHADIYIINHDGVKVHPRTS